MQHKRTNIEDKEDATNEWNVDLIKTDWEEDEHKETNHEQGKVKEQDFENVDQNASNITVGEWPNQEEGKDMKQEEEDSHREQVKRTQPLEETNHQHPEEKDRIPTDSVNQREQPAQKAGPERGEREDVQTEQVQKNQPKDDVNSKHMEEKEGIFKGPAVGEWPKMEAVKERREDVPDSMAEQLETGKSNDGHDQHVLKEVGSLPTGPAEAESQTREASEDSAQEAQRLKIDQAEDDQDVDTVGIPSEATNLDMEEREDDKGLDLDSKVKFGLVLTGSDEAGGTGAAVFRRFILGPGESVRVGRHPRGEVVLAPQGISNTHLEFKLISVGDGAWALGVRDLSANGTGVQMPGDSVRRLEKDADSLVQDGSVIVVPFRRKGIKERTCFSVHLGDGPLPDRAPLMPILDDGLDKALPTSSTRGPQLREALLPRPPRGPGLSRQERPRRQQPVQVLTRRRVLWARTRRTTLRRWRMPGAATRRITLRRLHLPRPRRKIQGG